MWQENEYFDETTITCKPCPSGTYGRFRGETLRIHITQCFPPPKILSMSPPNSTIAGGIVTIVKGENFGEVESDITFSVTDLQTKEIFTWKDVNYISPHKINVTSTFGYGQDLVAVIVVDGISSDDYLLNISDRYIFSYKDPKIIKIISPPLLGGTLQIVGESFSKEAESITEMLIVDKDCEIPCTDVRIKSATELQCEYVGTGIADTCTNKSLVIRTKSQESNKMELCYDVDRGEIENVPIAV